MALDSGANILGNIGTIISGTITTGSIIVTTGTQNAGTVNTGTINTGTINAGTFNTGTVNLGSVVKSVPAASSGSFTAAGSVVQAGSQADISSFDLQGTWVGTVFFEAQVGTSSWFGVPAYSNTGVIGTQTTGNGDFFVSAAGLDGVRARLTYSSGTLTYNSRTSNFFYPGAFSLGGTLANVGMVNAATVSALPNLPGGSIIVTTGTQNAGTVNTGTVNTGTINTGTINIGTFQQNAVPIVVGTTLGTLGTTGAAVWGTLVSGAGAGTRQYVSNLSIIVYSGTVDVAITNIGTGGTTGAGVLARGQFPPGGGLTKSFNPVQASGTGGTIAYWLGGAGTAYVDVSYWNGT